ncbi:Albumin-8 [Helianthus debilis subsp. tardiflorus]
MARFSIVFAAAGVLLLVAMAAVAEAYTTTIITTTIEENPYGRGRAESGCYQQMEEEEMLNHCGMYLMKNLGERSQGSPRMREEDHKQLCCMQLKNMDEKCMCPAIMMMLNEPMWIRMRDQVMSMAHNLPIECNLMSQPCQM